MAIKYTRRRIALCAIAGLVLLAVGSWAKIGLLGHQKAEAGLDQKMNERIESVRAEGREAKDAIKKAQALDTSAAWRLAAKAVDALANSKEKETLQGAILLKQLEAYGRARDALLEQGLDLMAFDDRDPRIETFIKRAEPFQAEIMKLIENPEYVEKHAPSFMNEEEQKAWKAMLWYHVGHANYSQLWFVPSEKKQDIDKLIQKSLGSFTRVFEFAPHDTRTEYAIESLYEVKKKKGGGGAGGQPKRPILLPQSKTSGTTTPDPGI